MSTKSLKHVVKRRVHLERSQPHERKKKFAILEKHSDYVLRAKDYHKKQKILREWQYIFFNVGKNFYWESDYPMQKTYERKLEHATLMSFTSRWSTHA